MKTKTKEMVKQEISQLEWQEAQEIRLHGLLSDIITAIRWNPRLKQELREVLK